MMDKICFGGITREALCNPKSKTAKAFFEGARAMMTTLELMAPDEYRQALSTKNQQHIIALLVKGEELQHERRRNDMEALLKTYWINKEKLRGFIFDVPALDDLNGRAMDGCGNYIEDEKFQLLPEYRDVYWPMYNITSYSNDNAITRDEYLALSDEERLDYGYIRCFMLETLNHEPVLRILNSDPYAMEALIRQDILIGDPEVNRRYLYAVTCDDQRFCELRRYEHVIMSAIQELNQKFGGSNSTIHGTLGVGALKNINDLND